MITAYIYITYLQNNFFKSGYVMCGSDVMAISTTIILRSGGDETVKATEQQWRCTPPERRHTLAFARRPKNKDGSGGGVMISLYTASRRRCAGSWLDDFIDITAAVLASETCDSVLSIVAQEYKIKYRLPPPSTNQEQFRLESDTDFHTILYRNFVLL